MRDARPAPTRGKISIARPITITMIPRIQLTSSASTIPITMRSSGSVMATGIPEALIGKPLAPGAAEELGDPAEQDHAQKRCAGEKRECDVGLPLPAFHCTPKNPRRAQTMLRRRAGPGRQLV